MITENIWRQTYLLLETFHLLCIWSFLGEKYAAGSFLCCEVGSLWKSNLCFSLPPLWYNQILSNRHFVSLSPTMLMICSRKKQDHPVIVFGFLSWWCYLKCQQLFWICNFRFLLFWTNEFILPFALADIKFFRSSMVCDSLDLTLLIIKKRLLHY